MYSSFKNRVKKVEFIVSFYDKLKRFYYKHLLSEERIIRRRFKKRVGRKVNLKNPRKYNDKLQWLKLNWYDPLASKCVDKYEVREVVKDRIGEEYLNELLAVYDSVEDIHLNELPDKFVLKGTHGSGFNIICEDKYKMDWEKEFKNMRRWLKADYYQHNIEWVYKDVKPRIICEKYLEETIDGGLRDYKIFCFNGEPKIIEVDFDRSKGHKRNFYDLDWNFVNSELGYPNDPSAEIKSPEKLTKMLELSRKLSEGFPHVRVDFYNFNSRILFGELTFFHASGMGIFNPEGFEIIMGDWLELPDSQ